MKYYQDITLIPDIEINLGFLWQKVFAQVHLALAANKSPSGNSAIAVSFPGYGEKVFPLGNQLRLLAKTEGQLQTLDLSAALSRLTDYCHYTAIKSVPQVETYASFRRKQFHTNIERLARRRAKRKNESLEQALQHYAGFKDQQSNNLPFINMTSLSRDKKFRLFIEREILEQPVAGEFSCYGLSISQSDNQATVPWF